MGDVVGDNALRDNIRPGKGKLPFECSISYILGQSGVVFISTTNIIVCVPARKSLISFIGLSRFYRDDYYYATSMPAALLADSTVL
jgi:hypothetical protein